MASPAKPLRIAAFDAAPVFRLGLAQALTREGMRIVAEGAHLQEAVSTVAAGTVDVILIDGELAGWPGDTGRALGTLIASTKVLLVASNATEESVRAAFAAGVRGLVSRAADPRELCDAVREVWRNEFYISPALAAFIMRKPTISPQQPECEQRELIAQLSWREGQILKLIGAGLMNKEIGRSLDLSEKSVKRYITGIFEKLHVRNRVEAALVCGTSWDLGNRPSLVKGGQNGPQSPRTPNIAGPSLHATEHEGLGGSKTGELGTHIVLTSTHDAGEVALPLWLRP